MLQELARKTGIGQPVINRIINSVTTNPNVGTLSPIAAFFSISIGELIGDVVSTTANISRLYVPGSKNPQQIPVISWVEALNWTGIKSIKKRHRMITTGKGVTEAAFALMMEDEVDLRFPKNSLLIVEPAKNLKNRDYVIVKQAHHPLAILKRYIVDGGIAYLKPIDPDLKTLELTPDFKILGVIVQSIFNFE